MVELKNDSDYDFTDISSEEQRVYDYGDDGELVIDDPQYLAVSDSGHRVLDGDGVSHFIQYGWKAIHWETKDDAPHFVK